MTVTLPWLTVRLPVKVLTPPSTKWPVPVLVMPPAPVIGASTVSSSTVPVLSSMFQVRLEAETIRDALLAVSGTLDPALGGNLLTVPNREFLFNHTSQDKASYENIRRRSLYVPVIRNHLYDVFQLFDYTDADVINGDRDSSTIAPQALFLMNSPFVIEQAQALAARKEVASASSDAEKIAALYRLVFARPPSEAEAQVALEFLQSAAAPESPLGPWEQYAQLLLLTNEFTFVD